MKVTQHDTYTSRESKHLSTIMRHKKLKLIKMGILGYNQNKKLSQDIEARVTTILLQRKEHEQDTDIAFQIRVNVMSMFDLFLEGLFE